MLARGAVASCDRATQRTLEVKMQSWSTRTQGPASTSSWGTGFTPQSLAGLHASKFVIACVPVVSEGAQDSKGNRQMRNLRGRRA